MSSGRLLYSDAVRDIRPCDADHGNVLLIIYPVKRRHQATYLNMHHKSVGDTIENGSAAFLGEATQSEGIEPAI